MCKTFRILKTLLLLVLVLVSYGALAQTKLFRGTIRDIHSEEIVPFASVKFNNSEQGKLSDSSGCFSFRFDNGWPNDSLQITYVGYQDYNLVFDSTLLSKEKDGVINFTIYLERGKYTAEVVVKRKIDKGLLMWRRIVRKKPLNDRYRFKNFSYELYNKLELDLKNINKEKISQARLMRPFKFIFENVDTSEGATVLPVYLTESISDYYFQKSPLKRREVFRASKVMGVNNESVAKLLGGMDQNVNFYSNFIPVMDKQFVSPISDNGDAYYNYKVLDTQFIGGRRFFHLIFIPRRKGENTFEGDCWVHDTTFAIQKMNLRLSKDANINFVEKLSLIQEYQLLNDSTWFLSKDKFVVDIAPLGKTTFSFIGKKTTTYKNILINNDSIPRELSKNKIIEEVILPKAAQDKDDEYWTVSRHEELNKSEQGVYKMIDTLLKMPVFQKYTDWINFIGTGYKKIGNFEIGPWYNWLSWNSLEGYRTRFDLGTNKYFNKKLYLHGYLAYGFTDRKLKYKADALYVLNKSPRTSIYASYLKDIDWGQTYYDEISQDNIFALAIRKSGVPIKFMQVEEKKLELFKETPSGFSVTLTGSNKSFEPLRNLPPKEIFGINGKDGPITSTEFSVKFRYAYLEKFLDGNYWRVSLGSPLPIVDFKFTKGVSGILNSGYNYSRISASVSDYKKIAPFGSLYFIAFGGQTFGTLPYMLLDIAPGNEIYYYNKYAFNLMNRYEYLHDKYAGFNFEHNIGNGLFKYIPITRKLKFRQFYTVRGLWGSLNEENRALNMPSSSPYQFESLNGRTYMELGTGVDNIFKLFRFDFFWRVLPRPLPPEPVKRFGVFGSFRVVF
ncbi:MAG: DUF5686 family protein [Flavitalea sp.]